MRMRTAVVAMMLSALAVSAQNNPANQPQGQGPGQAQEPKKIRLEGQVLSSAGDPLRRATVRLQPANVIVRGGPAGFTPPGSYSETTDENGKFVFENVDEGRYTLSAERTGYVQQRYGAATPTAPGAVLTLEPGDALTKLDLRLLPQAVIGGRVTDREGEPMQGVQVRAVQTQYTGGQKRLQAVQGGMTDDQGSFRIPNLAPGRYYLVADTRQLPVGGGPGMMAIGINSAQPGRDQAEREVAVATYYPNSLELRGAAPIEVSAGGEVLGSNIQMRREKVYSIKGAVANQATNGPASGARIIAIPAGADESENPLEKSTQAGSDGAFALHGLLPGVYTLKGIAGSTIQISSGGGSGNIMMVTRMATPGGRGGNVESNATGQMEVTLRDQDLENVGLLLTAGGEVPGTVRAESGEIKDLVQPPPAAANNPGLPPGVPPLGPGAGLNIRLIATEGVSINLPSARLDASGDFRLEGVHAGKYYVNVGGLAQGTYVKSIRFGGQDVTKAPLDLSGGGGSLDIVLAKGTGEITGSITNAGGDPMPGVSVSLWTRVPNLGAMDNGVRTVTTDQNGAFRFTALAPDEYYVAAWEELPDPGLGQHIPFLTRFASEAASVKLEAQAKPSVSAKTIGREKIAAQLANLP